MHGGKVATAINLLSDIRFLVFIGTCYSILYNPIENRLTRLSAVDMRLKNLGVTFALPCTTPSLIVAAPLSTTTMLCFFIFILALERNQRRVLDIREKLGRWWWFAVQKDLVAASAGLGAYETCTERPPPLVSWIELDYHKYDKQNTQ